MNSAAFSASLSGVAAIGVAALTAGSTYFLTKKREREADWRKMKLDIYKDHVAALSGQLSDVTAVHARHVDAINAVTLVASSDVTKAIYAFTDDAFIDRSGNQAELIRTPRTALRRDIYSPRRHKSENFKLRLFDISASHASDPRILAENK